NSGAWQPAYLADLRRSVSMETGICGRALILSEHSGARGANGSGWNGFLRFRVVRFWARPRFGASGKRAALVGDAIAALEGFVRARPSSGRRRGGAEVDDSQSQRHGFHVHGKWKQGSAWTASLWRICFLADPGNQRAKARLVGGNEKNGLRPDDGFARHVGEEHGFRRMEVRTRCPDAESFS